MKVAKFTDAQRSFNARASGPATVNPSLWKDRDVVVHDLIEVGVEPKKQDNFAALHVIPLMRARSRPPQRR